MPSKVNEIDSATLLDEENKKFRGKKRTLLCGEGEGQWI